MLYLCTHLINLFAIKTIGMKIFKTWITAAVLFGGLLLTACTNDDNPSGSSAGRVEAQLRKMTLREKVGQMFYVRPEALDTTIH